MLDTLVATCLCTKCARGVQVHVKLSKMEHCCDAVLGVIRDGFTVTEMALKFGVGRQSVLVRLVGCEVGARKPSPRSPIVPTLARLVQAALPPRTARKRNVGSQPANLRRILRIYGSSAVDFGIGKF
jgi:hypothetical protein